MLSVVNIPLRRSASYSLDTEKIEWCSEAHYSESTLFSLWIRRFLCRLAGHNCSSSGLPRSPDQHLLTNPSSTGLSLFPRNNKFATFHLPDLIGRHQDTEPLLDSILLEQLNIHLPLRHRFARQWNLMYSLHQHGASLKTLYRQAGSMSDGPCLLLIKDADDQVFGAFLNESLKPSRFYYGTGECFLWKQVQGQCVKYAWTGKNDYVTLCQNTFIAFGGGDSKFGLWINSDLEQGHTEKCPTFDNDVLSLVHKFSCVHVEIWSLCT